MSSLGETWTTKVEWRRALRRRRRELAGTTRSAEDRALRGALLSWLRERGIRTVCGYVPVRGEPGSPETLDAVLAEGCRVLLPVVVGAEPLDWADYTGPDSLRPADLGLLEPAGPRLGQRGIAEADAVLIPALAVDHRGIRLGQGGGHYDRSLPLAAPGALLVGVVRDEEFVAQLPDEPHDVRLDAVLTPERGVVPLPVVT
ncbi:5-formyltetrahydrofolate cyclo-ligase [Saccharopolyspora rosea]|uniref:5-formyltetrahydrofolate cyclo-ligase n=1 Tax=Saccharopolyspora rosea TaxID=524884 RepID=A0ABW3FQN1_9PSEU|nr:5-formyltetrahydrofolate cyclo-ligase [Saccharopolyspora rosea]